MKESLSDCYERGGLQQHAGPVEACKRVLGHWRLTSACWASGGLQQHAGPVEARVTYSEVRGSADE